MFPIKLKDTQSKVKQALEKKIVIVGQSGSCCKLHPMKRLGLGITV